MVWTVSWSCLALHSVEIQTISGRASIKPIQSRIPSKNGLANISFWKITKRATNRSYRSFPFSVVCMVAMTIWNSKTGYRKLSISIVDGAPSFFSFVKKCNFLNKFRVNHGFCSINKTNDILFIFGRYHSAHSYGERGKFTSLRSNLLWFQFQFHLQAANNLDRVYSYNYIKNTSHCFPLLTRLNLVFYWAFKTFP